MAAKERTVRSRELRLTDSRAEQQVWELLRAHRMGGLKFRRQHPIGPYFADFACVARKLVGEVDGEHHALQREADSRQTDFLEQAGWRVIRFSASGSESRRRVDCNRARRGYREMTHLS